MKTPATAIDPTPRWEPDEWALWSQEWEDPSSGGPTTVLVQHPTAPFARNLQGGPNGDVTEVALQDAAWDYLVETDKRRKLKLPGHWLEMLKERGADATFAWAPIRGPASEDADPAASFVFARYASGTGRSGKPKPVDRTVILLAGEQRDFGTKGKPNVRFLGSGFGLHVALHTRELAGKLHEVRITGCSVCLPFGPYWPENRESELLAKPGEIGMLVTILTALKPAIARLLALDPDSARTTYRGLRLGSEKSRLLLELHGTAANRKDGSKGRDLTPYAFTIGVTITEGKLDGQTRLLRKHALVTHATPGRAQVFPIDPASHPTAGKRRRRRPTEGESLDGCRSPERILAARRDPLTEPGCVDVMRTQFVREDLPLPAPGPGRIKRGNLPGVGPPVVGNDFSATNALKNLRELFRRFANYGIDPNAYFRTARLPVNAMYRSGIRPGPGKDGQTVNARVMATGWAADFFGPTTPGQRPELEVHFGVATLAVRARKRWNRVDRSPAEAFGITADPRWCWHEIGHVLLMAAVGELEFRFAHSAGDALAAIASDPASALARHRQRRGETFPFVAIPRRHDRCVELGWSWGGSFHRALRLLPDADRDRFKAYRTEQILSSSLFRLYRVIGGDTVAGSQADRLARESASHYAVYLVMRAIGLLPPAWMTPTSHAEKFVAALVQADIGTTSWTAKLPDGTGGTKTDTRIGGCAHKVIRWAFEAQGMFSADPRVDTNGPGLAPDVDIYIADRRPHFEQTLHGNVHHGPGTYVPVSLDWTGTPEWHSAPGAIDRRGRQVFVTVANRGRQIARNVQVRVWYRNWTSGSPPPKWEQGIGWTPVTATAVPPQDVAPGTPVRFGPFSRVPAGGGFIIFAQATCSSDFANSDPFQVLPGGLGGGTGLPCSRLKTSLVDLVANDNNLGVRVIP